MFNHKITEKTSGSNYYETGVSDTATESIYQAVKKDILLGELKPGMMISESQLSKHFEISRTPVREALNMLIAEGLLTSLARKGYVVNSMNISEMVEAYSIRELLEVDAVSKAVHRISSDELDRIKRSLLDSKEGDFLKVNYQFHMAIARGSRNRVLEKFIADLLIKLQPAIVMNPARLQWTDYDTEEHMNIIDALEARDEQKAIVSMRRHIQDSLKNVLEQRS
ncbi:MAG: GntR family transcriptional regulator [Anaerolineaceae bacterium]|nr:GntR family transcriptional regulator [Anaerolineaceae bacterium]